MGEQKRLDSNTIRARDIGMGRKNKSTLYIKSVCLNCGKERWIKANRPTNKGFTGFCKACSDTSRKRNGYKDDGYRFVPISSNDFYFSMANNQGYVQEHRLLMARYLGRILGSEEIVHHKNGIKDDNRMDNLELLIGASVHMYIHREEERKAELRKKIKEILYGAGCPHSLLDLECDKIMALIPDIERVSIQITEDLLANQKEKIEEAKKEERERIIKIILRVAKDREVNFGSQRGWISDVKQALIKGGS